jgi:hypothetical protein
MASLRSHMLCADSGGGCLCDRTASRGVVDEDAVLWSARAASALVGEAIVWLAMLAELPVPVSNVSRYLSDRARTTRSRAVPTQFQQHNYAEILRIPNRYDSKRVVIH